MQAPWPSTQYSLPVQRPRPTSDLRPHTAHASPAPSLFGNLQQVPAQDTTPRASMAQLTPYLHAPDRRLSRDDTAADISELLPSAHEDEASFAERHSPIAPDDVSQTWFDDVNFREFVQRQRRPSMLRLPSNLTSVSAESSTSSAARSSTSLGRKFSKTTRDKFTGLRENVSRNVGRIRRSSTSHIADSASSSTRHPMAPASPTSPSKRNGQFDGDRPSKLRQFQKFNDRKDTPAPPAFAMARPGSHNAAQDVLLTMAGGEAARNSAAAFRYAPSVHSQTSRDMREDLNARRSRLGSLSSAADSGADLNSPCPSHYSYKDSDGDVDMLSLEESQMDPLKLLPSEVCLQIFELLDAPDLARVELVSSSWREVAHKSSVWRTAFLRKYQRQIHTTPAPIQVGGAGCGRPNRPNQEWKRMYKARNELEANWRKGAKGAGKAIYLAGHTDSVYCLQFDEEKIITGSRDRTIRVWDINNYTCQRVIGGPNVKPVMGPKVLRTVDYPDFHLATASVNGTAYGNTIYHQPSQWHDASILCLQYDNEILVTGSSDSDLLIWDIKTYEPIKRLSRHTGGVLDVALDAKYIVSCSKDSRIIVWDRKTYEPIGELTGHRGPVNAVQLRGKLLVSASGDGIARLWDLEQMKLVKEFSAKERGLAAVEFSEDMQYVLAGGNDTITYKFETETGKEVKQFTGHNQLVRSLWLDSQNNRVVSGSYDLDLRVYDFETGDEIFRAEEWTTSWMLAAKSDYRRIVATSQDGRILVIDFGLNKCNDPDDGQPMIDGLDLLRGIDNTNAIQWRDPWERARQQERERERARARLLQQAQQQPLFS